MSGFAAWSRQVLTKPAQWPERKPVTRINVRLIPAFFGQHTVNIQQGDPHANIALNRSDIRFPEPFDDGGCPTDGCRAFITEAVRQAVRRDQHKRWIVWPDGSCTAYVRDDLTPVLVAASDRSVRR